MNLTRRIIFALIALIVFAVPASASAHVEVSPAKAPAGEPVDLDFHIGHGCDGAATTSLVVQLPTEAKDVSAESIEGWKAKIAPKKLTWTGGPLADHDEQEFPFTATFYGSKGDRVLLKAIQKCEGGAETAWIDVAGGASESENPAPAVTLTSSAAAPSEAADDGSASADDPAETGESTATAGEDSSEDDDGDGKSLLLIIVAGLAIGTVAGLVVRSRRNK